MDKETKTALASAGWKVGLGAVGLSFVYFGILRPILKKTNIISDAPPLENILEAQKMKLALSEASAIKSPVKAYTNPALLSASEIYDSHGFFDDDENLIYGVFRDAPSVLFLSHVTLAFKNKYKQSLKTYLTNFLNDSEMNNIKKIVEKLPLK